MDLLPDVGSFAVIADNTPQTIATFIGAVFLTLVLSKVAQSVLRGRVAKWVKKTEGKLDDVLLETLGTPLYWVILIKGLEVSFHLLVLPEGLYGFVDGIATVVMTMFGAWAVSSLITGLRVVYVDPITEASETKLDDQLVPLAEKAVKVGIWTLAILVAFANLGYDILSLLTGLGIGGLALAMAAQDTLANVFGSLTIFADRPFQVEDRVTMGGMTGMVEDVGLRTCRVRLDDGTLVTIPNSALTGNPVSNHTAAGGRRHDGCIGLVYETSSAEIERAIAGLKGVLAAHDNVRDDYFVDLINFGDSALELHFWYWVVPAGDYWRVVGEVNRGMLKLCEREGWDMAFPSMTIYKAE